jgi:hypothetical protein
MKMKQFKPKRSRSQPENTKAFLPQDIEKSDRAAIKITNFVKHYSRPLQLSDFEPVSLTPEATRIMVYSQMESYHRRFAEKLIGD